MAEEFAKTYEPQSVEDKWYENWQKNKLFFASNKSEKPAYGILMPPPNVTGILHLGHVLNITLQDLYIRWKRMQGYEACWFPGTDHAGIATQTKVEAELRKEGLTRYDLGREKFVEKVWEWKEKYGGIILSQMRKLGVSCDWDRTIFTLDESASNAVRHVFIKLYDEGFIYKGKKIINWSPLSQTALSDEEVEFREVKEHLYTLKYYFENSTEYLKVATVRPETIFGDTAVAVNPNDERYNRFIGKNVIVPLVGRLVPVIPDDYADPTFGTGCVKITPAHDPNDFEVGLRHNLEQINSINPDGTLNELTGEFDGVERFEARKRILAKLKELDLIEKIEDYTHNVGFSQRGGEPVEPYLSNQWFVSMKPLAKIGLNPLLEGDVRLFPNHWAKTYEHWMSNIRDWCISRQLWWGHRIPVYYDADGRHTAAIDEKEACRKLGLPQDTKLVQDADVLDTWFSSWLWPLTTMGWKSDGNNDTSDDLEKYLPTDLLVTGPEIIFFWVARMIMASMKFKGKIPFKDVYFTSTIRDNQGRKLSKSLGNSPDPLNIIDKYGCDALRFTIIYLSPLGQDVKLDVDVEKQDLPSIEIGRNFCNKIWNAGRFLIMKNDLVNLPDSCPECDISVLSEKEMTSADRWISSRFYSTVQKLNDALDNYKVNDYSKILYDFVWRDFCDWYIEILKIQLNGDNSYSYKKALMKFALELYDGILRLLHPIIPFITEEIWHLTGSRCQSDSICLQEYPRLSIEKINEDIENNFELMQSIIEEIRRIRFSSDIPPGKKLPVTINIDNPNLMDFLHQQSGFIAILGKCSDLKFTANEQKPADCLSSVVRGVEIYLFPGDAIDKDKDPIRLQKEFDRLQRNISTSKGKLGNPKFVANAAREIVDYEFKKLADMEESLEKIKYNLNELQ
ncbi:MAG: valyl-tRNA synthetase [Bacteroidota bacterium]|nr:valyl-tRNA synthetase [Bacteroidota bacterium]